MTHHLRRSAKCEVRSANRSPLSPLTSHLILLALLLAPAAPAADTNAPAWLTQPMSMFDAVKLALLQNSAVLAAEADLEATHGVIVQTRAIAMPKVHGSAQYQHNEAVEQFSFGGVRGIDPTKDEWVGNIRIFQSIYEGGRIRSALRTARVTKEQSLLLYQTVVADTLLAVRVAYFDVLLAQQQIVVQEASVKLLTQELQNTARRFDAGAVPRFDVLRGEVEVANVRPKLIRARNAHRIAKNNLATVLGYDIPATVWEDIPITLTGKLDAEPFDIQLPVALTQALQRRTELSVLQKEEQLRKEAVTSAKANYLPALGIFAGYGAHSSSFENDFYKAVAGPMAGVQLRWDIFDGNLTKGKVIQAQALRKKAQIELDHAARRIEQDVRTAYSGFLEAREVLESQKKVQEQAEEALRLAATRYEAGTGTQLDVLNAQTALTEARTTQIQALHAYAVARARLERAIGQDVSQEPARDRDK